MTGRTPPRLEELLNFEAEAKGRPVAIILAGHNGSGKSTLWYERLADGLQMPLINADRLTLSLLPAVDRDGKLKPWASRLRDEDARWHKLAQQGVQRFMALVIEQRMPFAFETVFSHWQKRADGTVGSKIDTIVELQRNGYFVVLFFVGLTSAAMSIARVSTRKSQGGHDVPIGKLTERFPRTQQAIGAASKVADMTLMFDNSRGQAQAFTLVRAQRRETELYDCRDAAYGRDADLMRSAERWLGVVAPR